MVKKWGPVEIDFFCTDDRKDLHYVTKKVFIFISTGISLLAAVL